MSRENDFAKQLAKFMTSLSSGDSGSSHEPHRDPDCYKTGIVKFQIDGDIYRYLDHFTNHVAMTPDQERDNGFTNTDMLMDRLSYDVKDKFDRIYSASDLTSHEEVKMKLCEVFGGKDRQKVFRKYFEKLKIGNRSFSDYYTETLKQWQSYNYCRQVCGDYTKNDDDFINIIIRGITKRETRKYLKIEIRRNNINTISALSTYVNSYHENLDDSDSDSSDSEKEDKKTEGQTPREHSDFSKNGSSTNNISGQTHLEHEINQLRTEIKELKSKNMKETRGQTRNHERLNSPYYSEGQTLKEHSDFSKNGSSSNNISGQTHLEHEINQLRSQLNKTREEKQRNQIRDLQTQINNMSRNGKQIENSSFRLNNLSGDSQSIMSSMNEKIGDNNHHTLQDARKANEHLQSLINTLQTTLKQQSVRNENEKGELRRDKEFFQEQYRKETESRLNNLGSYNYSYDQEESNLHNMEYRNNYNNRGHNRHSNNRDNGYRPHNTNSNYNSNYNNNYGSHNNPQRGRSRSPMQSNNRNDRSRSPSPTSHRGCFACGPKHDHWLIECDVATREEKETELIKILDKQKKMNNGQLPPGKEEILRDQFKIPKGKINQMLTHDKSKDPPGQGHFCKWCYVKNHSMFICKNYCPICEQTGHGWQACTRDSDLVEKRKQRWAALLARLTVYSSN